MSLLDFLNTDEGRLGLGLLAAGGPTAQPMGFGERIQMAMRGQDEYKQNQTRNKHQQLQYDQGLLSFEKAKRDSAMDAEIDAAARASVRTPQQAIGLSTGPMPDGGAMPTVQPGFDSDAFLQKLYAINPMKGVSFAQSIAKDNTPIAVAPGASLVDRRGNPIFTAPKEQKLPSSVEEYNFAKGQGYGGSYEQWTTAQKRAGASSVSVNTGQKGLDNELKIRSDFRSEPIYKAHQEVQSAHAQITQSLRQASPAGDLAGATKLMKILDPGSVVRESELGMAMAASGLMDRAENYAKMIVSGQKLTPTQRLDFQKLADNLAGESVKQYNAKRGEYAKFGKDYGLDGDRILGPEVAGAAPPAAPAAPMPFSPDAIAAEIARRKKMK